MTQEDIDINLRNFNITKEDLQKRAELENSIVSMASLVMDDFVKDYLLNNSNLLIYLTHTDSSRLVKNMKEFIVFIFTNPVDINYINRIYSIGSIHYSIKLDPAKVSYGFLAIKNILEKIYEIDSFLKKYRFLISKILSFVEYYMNDGYTIEKNKQSKVVNNELKALDMQVELLSASMAHKQMIKKVELSLSNNNSLEDLVGIEENPSACGFAKILEKLINNTINNQSKIDDLKKISSLHSDSHLEFVKLKMAIEDANQEDINIAKKKLDNVNSKLENQLKVALSGSIESAHIAISCAMKAIHSTTELFYKKNHDDSKEYIDELRDGVDYILKTHLGWVIESINIQVNNFSKEYDVVKLIRYMGENFYIGIEFSKSLEDNYISEIVSLLLEVLDLHFSVKEREKSLISFADKAESANKSKDMFLANMSHELRTPLNAISGFSQILLSQNDLPQNSKNFIDKIYKAGNHLLELVNTILDFAKLESGKMQFNPVLSNVSNLLNEVKILVSPLAQNKDITLKMPSLISLNLYVDPNLFKQALINLLSNAIKFTKNNGLVSLKLIYNQDMKQYVFEVQDNGVGLSQADIEKLFVAFSQVDNSYKKEHSGTGLGLMITKTIIEELHKGKIWVQSVKDVGSSFFISLPTPNIESKTYEVTEAQPDAMKVLIVEDTISCQKILIENLKSTYNLVITDSVNKAKNLLHENKYDFAVLDYFLIDGISSEILYFMEDEHIKVPTIVISAEDDVEILPSLPEVKNLKKVLNKKNIDEICNSIKL